MPPALFDAAGRRRIALGGSASWTEAEMLGDLRKVLKKHGRISASLIKQMLGAGQCSAYFYRFGTLSNAYSKIAYTAAPQLRTYSRGLPSRAAVIRALKGVQREYGQVNVRLIEQGTQLPSTYLMKKVFGSLAAAYAAAGLTGGR